MTIEELKQVRLFRQHITDKADKLTVCRDLNGIQAQFMGNVPNALKIRCNEMITSDNFGIGLVKNWTIRGTVHAFIQEDLPLFKYNVEHYRSNKWGGFVNSQTKEWMLTPERQKYFSDFIIRKVADGIGTREDLKEVCFEQGMNKEEYEGMFHPWGGGLREICERGFLCYKVQEKKEFMICSEFEPMGEEQAELEMVKRYLIHFAPATLRDTAYFFGWTQAKVKAVMDKLEFLSLNIGAKEYFYLETLKDNYPDVPKCVFLAGFDQLMLGYRKDESVFLPEEYLRGIFNLAGIVMPAILLNGQVVGRWRKKNTKIEFEMFHTVSEIDKKKIINEAELLFDDIKKVKWCE